MSVPESPSNRSSILRNAFAQRAEAAGSTESVFLRRLSPGASSVQISPLSAADEAHERRRNALASIDSAQFGWRHVRAIIVAGIGFFTDAYDIFAINLVVSMIGIVFFSNGKLPVNVDTAVKVATSGGTVLGQLFFGWLADRIGRKRMYGFELVIIILATLAQALSSYSPAISITGLLVFWRVVMGVGIGGDYPLSSVITSEFATTKWRGAMMGAVFAMQGLGQFAAAIMALIVTAGYKEILQTAKDGGHCTGECRVAVDKMWRIVIGIGAVPACFALYFRLTLPETPRFTFDVTRDHAKAESDVRAYLKGRSGHPSGSERLTEIPTQSEELLPPKSSFSDFCRHYSQWKNSKVLLGTAASWFFLDVAFYGLGLNNSIILSAIGWTGGHNLYEIFYRNAVGNIILICAGAIPGYWVTVATVDTVGRKPIQLMGFAILTILFVAIGFGYDQLKHTHNGLLGLYVVAQFFFNFGPNATTFIVPGECFPTRYRSTSHGISAAAGKIGAIIAQCVFGPLAHRGATKSNDSPWLNHVMEIFSLFMLCGFFSTFLIPETKRKSLEELAGETVPRISFQPPNDAPVKDEEEIVSTTFPVV
ncbi:unnamed protein product [Penicillium salamii]|uniref:Major facilitator superfamily (MFS) profile domain-containing protein n=1 Tax=Penicillium salamii TaxID=1612424 RepID=A0A9W4NWZ7_9EURO|nr:unnamed protein product [Penicillium salamii]CAG8026195.1 unnamed protein product [Penicillium salamii]CAG8057254.1 unnamed protein product [Penicillium salamii]CAG8132778.1 unnamed protein product [Penicillium salamii]CAG8177064.1 unnamed protein product [Penicillium salamii]